MGIGQKPPRSDIRYTAGMLLRSGDRIGHAASEDLVTRGIGVPRIHDLPMKPQLVGGVASEAVQSVQRNQPVGGRELCELVVQIE